MLAVMVQFRARVVVGSTVQASAFKAEETGEDGGGFSRMGDGELAWQVVDEAWICYSGASTHMTPSADHVIDYKECNLKLRIADDTTRPIEGCGDINFVFRSGNCLADVLLTNVAHVPDLSYHLPAHSRQERSRF